MVVDSSSYGFHQITNQKQGNPQTIANHQSHEHTELHEPRTQIPFYMQNRQNRVQVPSLEAERSR